jgi:zinc D-Ala-D-Ala carboxypeptidase
MSRPKRRNRYGKYQALVAALLILLAGLMLYTRGQRVAQRTKFDSAGDSLTRTDHLKEVTDTLKIMEAIPPDSPLSPQRVPATYLLGHSAPVRDTAFVAVDGRFASREGMYMLQEAYEAFQEMHHAAAADGVQLIILSAMRTNEYQKRIWENKWHGRQLLHGGMAATSIADPVERAREILRFSAMPGTSRHHWGTDIDLNALENSYFESGEGKEIYDWLLAHAADFGFCQPYKAKGPERPHGYEEEKWHWSYMPVAAGYLRAYETQVTYDDLTGFDGWETARQIGVIEHYVTKVSTDCRWLEKVGD